MEGALAERGVELGAELVCRLLCWAGTVSVWLAGQASAGIGISRGRGE